MARYVILRHELPPESGRDSHWDLMLEWGDILRTWALQEEPCEGISILADELANHRLAYLDYEGPVSGDRGSVSRWDQGEFRLERSEPDFVEATVEGARLALRIALARREPDGHLWLVSFGAAPMRDGS